MQQPETINALKILKEDLFGLLVNNRPNKHNVESRVIELLDQLQKNSSKNNNPVFINRRAITSSDVKKIFDLSLDELKQNLAPVQLDNEELSVALKEIWQSVSQESEIPPHSILYTELRIGENLSGQNFMIGKNFCVFSSPYVLAILEMHSSDTMELLKKIALVSLFMVKIKNIIEKKLETLKGNKEDTCAVDMNVIVVDKSKKYMPADIFRFFKEVLNLLGNQLDLIMIPINFDQSQYAPPKSRSVDDNRIMYIQRFDITSDEEQESGLFDKREPSENISKKSTLNERKVSSKDETGESRHKRTTSYNMSKGKVSTDSYQNSRFKVKTKKATPNPASLNENRGKISANMGDSEYLKKIIGYQGSGLSMKNIHFNKIGVDKEPGKVESQSTKHFHLEDYVSDLKKQIIDQGIKHEKEIKELKDDKIKIEERYEKAIKELRDEKTKEVQELRDEKTKEVQELRDEKTKIEHKYEKTIQELKDEKTKEIQELKDEKTKIEHKYEKTIQELKEEKTKEIQELKEEKLKEIQELRDEKTKEIQELKDEKTKEVQELRDEKTKIEHKYEKTIQELKEEKIKEMRELKEEKLKEIQDSKADKINQEQKYEKAIQELKEEKVKAERRYEEHVEDLKETNQKLENQLKEQIQKNKRQKAKNKTALEEIQKQTREYERRIETLKRSGQGFDNQGNEERIRDNLNKGDKKDDEAKS